MADDIRRLSDELARDPASPASAARRGAARKGQLDLALKVALRGLERHPHDADAHDLLARIAVDRGELERAFDEWDMVLPLAPAHLGARKGMGFVCFQQGRYAEAQTYLSEASAARWRGRDGGDGARDGHECGCERALQALEVARGRCSAHPSRLPRRHLTHDPRYLFADVS